MLAFLYIDKDLPTQGKLQMKKYIKKDTVFIEPFCGSCAVSYYLWLKHPTLKFILNDGDTFLYEMFNLIQGVCWKTQFKIIIGYFLIDAI